MKYVVEFEDGDEKEFHSVSQSKLRDKVKQWMEEDGSSTEADVYTEHGRFLFTVYL